MISLAPRAGTVLEVAVREVSVSLEAVAHTYRARTGSVEALRSTDLIVRQGEFVALIGPSGCGKTTLLRILGGLLEPSEGRVLLDGGPPHTAQKARAIGWLAQDDGLLPWRTVAENVALPLRLARRAERGAVGSLLERVGLADSERRYPHELSGGMRQRAALARALVASPSFLLLDEPFAHLDELTRERLGDLLLELRAGSRLPPTTLLVTHSVAEAVRLADRVVVFSRRPGMVVCDVDMELPSPRSEEQAGFGAEVARLKSALRA